MFEKGLAAAALVTGTLVGSALVTAALPVSDAAASTSSPGASTLYQEALATTLSLIHI